jgi:hypothetical protein
VRVGDVVMSAAGGRADAARDLGAVVSGPATLSPPPVGAMGWAPGFVLMWLAAGGSLVFVEFRAGRLLLNLAAGFVLAALVVMASRRIRRATVTAWRSAGSRSPTPRWNAAHSTSRVTT